MEKQMDNEMDTGINMGTSGWHGKRGGQRTCKLLLGIDCYKLGTAPPQQQLDNNYDMVIYSP